MRPKQLYFETVYRISYMSNLQVVREAFLMVQESLRSLAYETHLSLVHAKDVSNPFHSSPNITRSWAISAKSQQPCPRNSPWPCARRKPCR